MEAREYSVGSDLKFQKPIDQPEVLVYQHETAAAIGQALLPNIPMPHDPGRMYNEQRDPNALPSVVLNPMPPPIPDPLPKHPPTPEEVANEDIRETVQREGNGVGKDDIKRQRLRKRRRFLR